MLSNFHHGYPFPFLPVSGSVVSAGQWGDLKHAAGSVSIGIYDDKTYGVATAAGNGKDFFIGYSREHTADNLTFQLSGMKLPGKSQVFQGKDVMSFEFSNPQKPQNETWVIGYNGSPSSVGLQFQKGKAYGIQIDLSGNPIFNVFGRTLRHEIWVTVPDTDDDCEIGCDDGVDCEKYTRLLVEQINNHNELKPLGVKARVVTDTFEIPVTTITKYRISLNDGCGDNGIGTVQGAVGRLGQVSVVSKNGCVTTYEVCAATTPPAITPPREYALADCAACAAGYTLVASSDTWIVSRPLSGDDDLSDGTAQAAFATAVQGEYSEATASTYLGQNGSVAKIKIVVPAGTAVAAEAADTVEQSAPTGEYCQSNTVPSPISWTSVGTSYRVQRQLTITLPRLDCEEDQNRLEELTAYVTQFPDYVSASITVNPANEDNGQCADDYTISQWSIGCLDAGCQSLDEADFLDFPGYDGVAFKPVPVADLPPSGKKCGIEVTAGYVNTVDGDCSFDPNDFYETDPITIQLTKLTVYPYPEPYEIGEFPAPLRTKKGLIGRQSGEWVLRNYIHSAAYSPFGQFWKNPKLREAFNSRMTQQVDRSAYYKIYYLTFKAKRETQDQFKEQFEATFAIKETEIAKQQAFETAFLAPLAKFGVVLQQRDV